MEDRPIVFSSRGKCQEIEGRSRTSVAEDFGLDVPVSRVNGDRHNFSTPQHVIGDIESEARWDELDDR